MGPVVLLPTSFKRPQLGVGEFGLRPTGVVLMQKGPWTYGVLVNHVWTLGDAGLSLTFLQPFLSHASKSGWGWTVNTETLRDWTNDTWTVPVNVVVSKLSRLGRRPVSYFGGVRVYLETPNGQPDWGLRAGITLLYPR